MFTKYFLCIKVKEKANKGCRWLCQTLLKYKKIPVFQTVWESDILADQNSTGIQYSITLHYTV